jgi:hypothetical protein
MPTPDTTEAVAKLIEARQNLTEVTKQLHEAHPHMNANAETRRRYAQVQEQWEVAFKKFGTAVEEFTAAIQRAKPSN